MSNLTRQSVRLLAVYPTVPDLNHFGVPATNPSRTLDQILLQGSHWRWYNLGCFLVVCQLVTIFWRYWWKAPSHIPIIAYPTPFGRWLMAWHLMIDSERILLNAYEKSQGKSFAIPTTERWIIFVSDSERIRQFHNESELILSTEQALHDLAFTKQLLGSHQQAPEHRGFKSENHRVVIGILKNKLRSKIPDMSQDLRKCVDEAIAYEVPIERVSEQTRENGEDWQRVRLMPALLRIFTRVNLVAFFGAEDVKDPSIYFYTIAFFWNCACAFFMINLVPTWLVPIVVPVAMGFGITRQKVFDFLQRLADQCQKSDICAGKEPDSKIMQWTVKMTKFRDTASVARIALGLVFASAFQIPMITQSCIYRLCKHPEFQPTLISEAEEYREVQFGSKNQEMPYLDSLLRETARLSPGPVVTSPRAVMQPYISPNEGFHVPIGNWLAVPQLAVMQDEKIWPQARAFKPFRFVDEEKGASRARFTHPGYDFPFWGSPQGACPSRFYVSVIMKMVLSHILRDYEIKLANPTAKSFLSFGIVRIPSPFLIILMRRRARQHVGH